MNNYDYKFLNRISTTLYDNINSAIENMVIAPDISAFKIRKSVEFIVDFIGNKKSLILSENLFENLTKYKELDIPEHVYSTLNKIRVLGNIGVHDNKIDTTDIEYMLELFDTIISWFCKTYTTIQNVDLFLKNNHTTEIEKRYGQMASNEDKDFYYRIMSSIQKHINYLIKEKYANSLNNINHISFEEYYGYFLDSIKYLSTYSRVEFGITSEHSLNAFLKFKRIAMMFFGTSDNYRLNKLIAEKLYSNTSWYVFSKYHYGERGNIPQDYLDNLIKDYTFFVKYQKDTANKDSLSIIDNQISGACNEFNQNNNIITIKGLLARESYKLSLIAVESLLFSKINSPNDALVISNFMIDEAEYIITNEIIPLYLKDNSNNLKHTEVTFNEDLSNLLFSKLIQHHLYIIILKILGYSISNNDISRIKNTIHSVALEIEEKPIYKTLSF